MENDILKMMESLCVKDEYDKNLSTTAIDYLKFCKFVFITSNHLSYFEVECVLNELKRDFPKAENIPKLPASLCSSELIAICTKNKLQPLVEDTATVLLEMLIENIEEDLWEDDSENAKLLKPQLLEILECLGACQSSHHFGKNNIHKIIVNLVDSLMNMLDGNKEQLAEKLRINDCIKNILILVSEKPEVRQDLLIKIQKRLCTRHFQASHSSTFVEPHRIENVAVHLGLLREVLKSMLVPEGLHNEMYFYNQNAKAAAVAIIDELKKLKCRVPNYITFLIEDCLKHLTNYMILLCSRSLSFADQ